MAKVVSGTLTVALQQTGSASNTDSVDITQTSYTRVRSGTGFTPSGTNTYQINLANGTTPSVIAARLIIIQNAATVTGTETQIEVGNYEAFTATTPSALTSPKYWTYDSSLWNGTKTFYAEATYVSGSNTATETFSATGTYTGKYAVTTVSGQAWGGGAGGSHNGASAAKPGGGGGGGAYAKTASIATTPGSSYTATVGAAVAAETNGNQSSFTGDSAQTVVAAGGTATTARTGGAGGVATSPTVGDVGSVFAGGAGGTADNTNNYGGAGGGEGAGTTATGNNGSANSTSTGGAGGTGGDGGDGGRGGDNSDSPTISSAGTAPGGGGGGSGGNVNTGKGGAAGQVKISWTSAVKITLQEDDGSFGSTWTDVATIVAAGTVTSATRARSSSFSPTNGKHYRIAVVRSDSGISPVIYNAKVVVDQSSNPTLLEPQYLLLNTKSTSTGLQSFNNSFDPAEWSGVSFTYKHAQDAIGSTANSRLDDVDNGNAVLTNSSITGANQQIGSTITDMPTAAHNLDTDIVAIGTEIDASRILVSASIPENPWILFGSLPLVWFLIRKLKKREVLRNEVPH